MLPEPGGGKEEEGEPRDARGKVYRLYYMSRASTVVAKRVSTKFSLQLQLYKDGLYGALWVP